MPTYVNLPSTPHFAFSFDETLDDGGARALGAALFTTAEQDYGTLSSWFDGLIPGGVPFNVQINHRSASRSGSNDQSKNVTIDLGATTDFTSARWVLVAETVEIFMAAQNAGWKPGASNGEALSQVAGFTLYPAEVSALAGPQTWLDSSNPTRPDFVSTTDATDKSAISYGCGVLFIYYLFSQLGFAMRAIVRAAADTLERVYHNLTQDSGAFPTFAALLASKFPLGVASKLVGSTNPFPLPSGVMLSARQYLRKDAPGTKSLGKLVSSQNIGDLRALLNSDRPASLVV